jgi:hypothetical protein
MHWFRIINIALNRFISAERLLHFHSKYAHTRLFSRDAYFLHSLLLLLQNYFYLVFLTLDHHFPSCPVAHILHPSVSNRLEPQLVSSIPFVSCSSAPASMAYNFALGQGVHQSRVRPFCAIFVSQGSALFTFARYCPTRTWRLEMR